MIVYASSIVFYIFKQFDRFDWHSCVHFIILIEYCFRSFFFIRFRFTLLVLLLVCFFFLCLWLYIYIYFASFVFEFFEMNVYFSRLFWRWPFCLWTIKHSVKEKKTTHIKATEHGTRKTSAKRMDTSEKASLQTKIKQNEQNNRYNKQCIEII